jgi:hypothetical protein
VTANQALGSSPPARDTRGSRWRVLAIAVIFFLGLLIGWLLAPKCAHCSSSAGTAGQASGSAPSGHGKPERSSSAPSTGTPDGANLRGAAADVDRGSGTARDGREIKVVGGGQVPVGTSADSQGGSADGSPQIEVPADKTAPGLTLGDGSDAKDRPDTPPNQVLTASDFRYDKTGLPRYPQSVSTIGSTLTHDRGPTGGYHSTCAIVTSSNFQEVVDWYKAQLPAGWHAQTVGDLTALAQQVSIGNIMKTLTGPTPTAGTPPSNESPAHTDNPLSVAMFSPPSGTTGEPGIMIKQKAGQSVEITMSKNGADP